MKWLKTLIEPLAEIFTAKISLKKAKLEAEAQAFQTAAQSVSTWEQLAAKNASGSYLDELWTAVLLVPLIMAFAGYEETVTDGFSALENMPEFYVWAVMASVGWAFARKDIPALSSWAKRLGGRSKNG